MWFSGIPFVIGAWLTISTVIPAPIAQWSDTTSVILLEYSEPMSIDSLLYPGNYKILSVNDNKSWIIYKIGLVKELRDSTGNLTVNDSSLVVIVSERLPYRQNFEISVVNVKDKAGNMIDPQHKTVWYFSNGYTPNKIPKPMIELR